MCSVITESAWLVHPVRASPLRTSTRTTATGATSRASIRAPCTATAASSRAWGCGRTRSPDASAISTSRSDIQDRRNRSCLKRYQEQHRPQGTNSEGAASAALFYLGVSQRGSMWALPGRNDCGERAARRHFDCSDAERSDLHPKPWLDRGLSPSMKARPDPAHLSRKEPSLCPSRRLL